MDKKKQSSGTKNSNIKVKKAGKTEIKSDVQGSYTGVPENKHDRPVQDADDL